MYFITLIVLHWIVQVFDTNALKLSLLFEFLNHNRY